MAKKLTFVATHGSENPTKAVFPFLQAKNAAEAGMEAEVVVMGDAVVMMRDVVANSVIPVGWPPFRDIFASVVEHKIPIYV